MSTAVIAIEDYLGVSLDDLDYQAPANALSFTLQPRDREAEVAEILRRDRALSLANRGLTDEGVTFLPGKGRDHNLRFDRHQFQAKPIADQQTSHGRQQPPESPDRNIAAAVVYQALKDSCSDNRERADEAKEFLLSDEENHRVVRGYWLNALGIQPRVISKLRDLSREQMQQRLRYASNKPRAERET